MSTQGYLHPGSVFAVLEVTAQPSPSSSRGGADTGCCPPPDSGRPTDKGQEMVVGGQMDGGVWPMEQAGEVERKPRRDRDSSNLESCLNKTDIRDKHG